MARTFAILRFHNSSTCVARDPRTSNRSSTSDCRRRMCFYVQILFKYLITHVTFKISSLTMFCEWSNSFSKEMSNFTARVKLISIALTCLFNSFERRNLQHCAIRKLDLFVHPRFENFTLHFYLFIIKVALHEFMRIPSSQVFNWNKWLQLIINLLIVEV